MESASFVFDCPVPPWSVAAVGALMLMGLLLVVRRDTARLRRWIRLPLLLLVALATLMIIALALGPRLVRTRPDPQKQPCIVLVDASRSMQQEDVYSGKVGAWVQACQRAAAAHGAADGRTMGKAVSRQAMARWLLAGEEAGWLREVRASFSVSGHSFATEVQGLPLGTKAKTLAATGVATHLGDALEAVALAPGAERPRAVIVLSDGAWNRGRDPTEVAQILGRLNTPVYAVGLGAVDPPLDVVVHGVRGPRSALLGDDVGLVAEVGGTGLGARTVPIQLLADGVPVAQKQAMLLGGGRKVRVRFSVQPDTPGVRRYVVRVPAQAEERDLTNNQATAMIDVVERKIRVLLVENEPRWEFRFLRSVLGRDPAVKPTVCLLRAGVGPVCGKGYVAAPPVTKKDLAAYDLIILGDVPARELPAAFLEQIAAMVRRKGSALLVMAGRCQHYLSLAGTAVGKILPVALERGAVTMDVGIGARDGFRAELTQDGADHLMTRLSADMDENEQLWASLPPLRWAATTGPLARGATALLVHPLRLAGTAKAPLVAVQRVGTGKVMWCGVQETWRWRRCVGDKYHYRFWAQTVRWLVRRTFAKGDQRARLSVDRQACDVGETIEIEAYCLDSEGYPLENAEVAVQIQHQDGATQRLSLNAAPGGWGLYRTRFVPTRVGTFRFRPLVKRYGGEPLPSEAKLRVNRVDLEGHFLAQDEATLRAMAEASGGAYLQPHEVNRLPALLQAKLGRRERRTEIAPCRHWAFYSSLVCILAMVWVVRKRSGLV